MKNTKKKRKEKFNNVHVAFHVVHSLSATYLKTKTKQKKNMTDNKINHVSQCSKYARPRQELATSILLTTSVIPWNWYKTTKNILRFFIIHINIKTL